MCLLYFTNLRLIAAIQGMSKQNPEKTMYIHGQTECEFAFAWTKGEIWDII